jgi:hypothetical protein
MGKYSLIVVAGFVFIFGYVKSNLNEVAARFSDNFLDHYERAASRLTASSTANMALAMLADSTSWRTGYSNVSVGDGTGWATIEDNSTDTTLSAGEVRITAAGSSGDIADTVVVMALLPTIPPGVHGGITANTTVKTLGNLVIDGRDHDLNGTSLVAQGTMGVSTMGTYDQGGSSTGGGTAGGVDYMPSKPANSAIIEENATYTFPSSPDDVFGYTDGTLKTMAQSGANGGQYATNSSSLTLPLSGVTYLELADGATWQSMDFGASSGVLVVHNSSNNAALKNLNGGTFKGLIIADEIEKVHCTIIGAVIALSPTPSGNCIGNGSGSILYSSAALQQSASVAVGGAGTVAVTSWLE